MLEIKVIRPDIQDVKAVVFELQRERWETLEFSYTETALNDFIKDPDNYLLLGYLDSTVVGMLEAYNLQKPDERNKEMFLYAIETKLLYRGQGIAKAMILKLREIAIEKGAHEIWVLTGEDDQAAIALYQGLGIKTRKSKQLMYNYPLI